MAHMVIDGYNYIGRLRSFHQCDDPGLDMARRSLLEKLFRFKKQRGGRITVVFDAYNSFSTGRQQENHKGIDVVYSTKDETADTVIIGWIRKKPAGLIVVTSDRAIIDEAKNHGVPFLIPGKLAGMMAEAADIIVSPYGKDDDMPDAPFQVKKKGNPRKLPKKLRKVVKTIDKL